MHKEEFDQFAVRQPFRPSVVRLVDGRRFTFRSPEQHLVSRRAIYTLDKKGDGLIISLDLIPTVHVNERNGNGRTRRGSR